jgi:hypothetical protein
MLPLFSSRPLTALPEQQPIDSVALAHDYRSTDRQNPTSKASDDIKGDST